MANNINTNPILVDTFAGDVVLSTRPICMEGASFFSTTATDHVAVVDKNGVEVSHLWAGSDLLVPVVLNNPPYTVDVSAGVFAGTARLFIYQQV